MTRPEAVRIARIGAFAYRCPNDVPVETSFGIMRDRPAVFVRIEDDDGVFGWGEIFANWPSAGAEHRVNLLHYDIAPLILGKRFAAADELFRHLDPATRIRALQCGEPGPFMQVIAGLDIALWDLFARRAGVPLRRLLNPNAPDRVAAYASGIHYRAAETVIPEARAAGFEAFKVKVGFDPDVEEMAVLELIQGLEDGESLAADANQGWDVGRACGFLDHLRNAGLTWIEEPIPACSPQSEWDRLAQMTNIPLAGGENIAGYTDFDHAIGVGPLTVIQPDVVKWGGITGCLQVARAVLAAGKRFCPHYLAGGVGLAASAEILAAAGGDGLLEVDVNPNPLREEITPTAGHIANGKWRCNDRPGLGIETIPDSIDRYRTHDMELAA